MGFKTGLFVGAGIGYLVATRLDQDTRARIERAVNERFNQLRDDPRVKEFVGSASDVANQVVDSVADKASATAEDVTSGSTSS